MKRRVAVFASESCTGQSKIRKCFENQHKKDWREKGCIKWCFPSGKKTHWLVPTKDPPDWTPDDRKGQFAELGDDGAAAVRDA
eukprot:gene24550-7535_t